MTVTLEQFDSDATFVADNISVALTGVKAGSLLVVFIGMEGTDAQGLTVADGTHTYEIVERTLNATTDGSGNYELEAAIAYVLAADAGDYTITVTHSGGSYVAAHVREFSTGESGFSFVDSAGDYGGDNAPNSGAVTGSGEVAVGGTTDWSSGTGMTDAEIPDNTDTDDEIATGATHDLSGSRIASLTDPEFTSTESGSQEWVSVIALFDEVAGGGDIIEEPGAGSLALAGKVPGLQTAFKIDVPTGPLW